MNRIDTSKKQSFELYISVILMVVLLASVILSLLSYINNRRALGQIDSDADAQMGFYPIAGDYFDDLVMHGDSLSEYYGAGGDIVFDESEYGYTEDSITINTGAFNQIRLDEYGIVPKTVYLGDAVTRIEARAFYATTAEEIRLTRGLGYIGPARLLTRRISDGYILTRSRLRSLILTRAPSRARLMSSSSIFPRT